MHGFEKKQVAMNLCWIDSYLYFDEDQRSFMVIVGFFGKYWECFFFYIQVISVFWA